MNKHVGIGVAEYYANYNVFFRNNLVDNTAQVSEIEVPHLPESEPSVNS